LHQEKSAAAALKSGKIAERDDFLLLQTLGRGVAVIDVNKKIRFCIFLKKLGTLRVRENTVKRSSGFSIRIFFFDFFVFRTFSSKNFWLNVAVHTADCEEAPRLAQRRS
jgi:hypothetical protein